MIRIIKLTHRYKGRTNAAIKNVSLQVKKGESLVLLGSSGSGKSTLLRCINRLIEPQSGKIYIQKRDILNCTIREAENLRSRIGMVFQSFCLIERSTVMQNVLNGRLRFVSSVKTILGLFSDKDRMEAEDSIRRVGMLDYKNERVSNLSGGQKQRVAIARVLCQHPDIILADEPVSSLDPKLMIEIMDLLKGICNEKGITLITSLHFLDFAKRYADRIVGLREGRVVFTGGPEDLTEKDIVDIYGKTKDWYLYGKIGY